MYKPTIILGAVSSMGIFKSIEKNLIFHGYDVINIVNDKPFKYPNLFTYFKVKLARLVGNKKLKQDIEQEWVFQQIKKQLENYPSVDYALFFSAHTYSHKTLELVRKKTKYSMVNIQQDGINRYPHIWERMAHFDRFYVFDPKDIQNHNGLFLPTTNFYFDNHHADKNQHYDFYFIGSHIQSRQNDIIKFSEYAKQHQLKLNFKIICKKKELNKLRKTIYLNNNIELTTEILDYQTNLELSKQSKVLLDFVINEHKGLSYRTFEALGFNKKLITTNETIRHYDFYHPNNIFVLEDNNFELISDFLNKPYIIPPEDVKRKYGFKNWLSYVLEIPPYQKISLPEIK